MPASFDNIETTCPGCGRTFRKLHARHFFCSPRCRARDYRAQQKLGPVTLKGLGIDPGPITLDKLGIDTKPVSLDRLHIDSGPMTLDGLGIKREKMSLQSLHIDPNHIDPKRQERIEQTLALAERIAEGEKTSPFDEALTKVWKDKDEPDKDKDKD